MGQIACSQIETISHEWNFKALSILWVFYPSMCGYIGTFTPQQYGRANCLIGTIDYILHILCKTGGLGWTDHKALTEEMTRQAGKGIPRPGCGGIQTANQLGRRCSDMSSVRGDQESKYLKRGICSVSIKFGSIINWLRLEDILNGILGKSYPLAICVEDTEY